MRKARSVTRERYRSEEYLSYMESSAWRAKREEVFSHYGRWCHCCGFDEELQVHHLTYERLSNERMSDLMPLCKFCHEQLTYEWIHRDEIPTAVLGITSLEKFTHYQIPSSSARRGRRRNTNSGCVHWRHLQELDDFDRMMRTVCKRCGAASGDSCVSKTGRVLTVQERMHVNRYRQAGVS